jgi:hypothetical protein
MIQLIQNIQGNFITEIKGGITYAKSIEANIQREDYINIYAFTAFLQNLSQTPITNRLAKPFTFGYTPPIGITEQNIDINY